MARVPAGEFLMGCSPGDSECFEDEIPTRRMWVDEFWMDATEVTVAAYRRCVEAGTCSAPNMGGNCTWNVGGREQHPVNCVDWNQARAYCDWAGKRLPTEAEWERAARGGTTDARYGELARIAWHGSGMDKATEAVERKQANAYGLCDMLGNVWEWTDDWYWNYGSRGRPGANPGGPAGHQRSLRGGAYTSIARFARASARFAGRLNTWNDSYGFRCARSAAPAP